MSLPRVGPFPVTNLNDILCFFGFATLGGLQAALFRSTMKRVEDGTF
jgi:hypothetical protein